MTFSNFCSVTETMSDEDLAIMAREGSDYAFSLLVSRCAPIIKKQAAAFHSQQMETEDLAQEGLMGLLSAVRFYKPTTATTASFRTYASVCIRHRILSAIKRSGAARMIPASELVSMDDDQETPLALLSGENDPAQLVVQKEEMFRLHGRLRELLSQKEYDVLMLYLSAYSYDEIAQCMSMTSKAVDNALQRVRRKLLSVSLLDN